MFWNLWNARAYRSGHTPFYDARDSKVFFLTLLLILGGQILIVEIGGAMFNVVPIQYGDWIRIILVTSTVMLVPQLIGVVSRCFSKDK